MMPKAKKFPYRRSINFTELEGQYLDALVEKRYFDSHSQAVRWFIDQFDTHMLNLRKNGFDCVLPLMSEMVSSVQLNEGKKNE